MSKPTVAIIGASTNREKFGNKAVRAFLQQGYDVFPVHPTEQTIEGLKVFRSVTEIPFPLDKVSLYVPPTVGMKLADEIAKKGCKELWLNPGADSPELYEKAQSLGLNPIVACSIVGVGVNPHNL
ncbi:MAG: CoA-binding protein [Verrucomicrobia bacterium]|nr:CoA-binding protein [Verrucomicrobiota bacterium]